MLKIQIKYTCGLVSHPILSEFPLACWIFVHVAATLTKHVSNREMIQVTCPEQSGDTSHESKFMFYTPCYITAPVNILIQS